MIELNTSHPMLRWLRTLLHRPPSQTSSPRQQHSQPTLEPLEGRELLSIAVLQNVLSRGDVVRLEADGELRRTVGRHSTLIATNAVQAVQGLTPRGVKTLFYLDTSNNLFVYARGRSIQLADNSVSIAGPNAAGHGVLFNLLENNQLFSYGAAGWNLLDNSTATIVSGVNNQGKRVLYDLQTNGRFSTYGPGGWKLLDATGVAIAAGVNAAGKTTVFELQSDNELYAYGVGAKKLLDDSTVSIVSGLGERSKRLLFALNKDGELDAYGQGGWKELDAGTVSIASGVTPDGQQALFDVRLDGSVWAYNQNGWLQMASVTTIPGTPTASPGSWQRSWVNNLSQNHSTIALAGPAGQGLVFINGTDQTIYVALEYHVDASDTNPEEWLVQGWIAIAPRRSVSVRDVIDNRYYYYFAVSATEIWSGTADTEPVNPFGGTFGYNSLDQVMVSNLLGAGYMQVGFRQLDVGEENVVLPTPPPSTSPSKGRIDATPQPSDPTPPTTSFTVLFT